MDATSTVHGSNRKRGEDLKTVARAVEVLKAFANADDWSVSALARELGLHKSVTQRILATLASGGLLVKDPRSERYALSMVVASLARRAERRASLTHLARPYLIELADASQETVSLCVLNGNTGLCLDSIDSSQSMRFTVNVGEAFFLTAGAAGKALLAFQSPAAIERALSVSPLPRYTESTITDPAQLRLELDEIRRTGLAYSDAEITPGARSVGAPVWNHEGRVVGSIVISAPAFRMEASDRGRLERLLKTTDEGVSAALGFTGRYPWTLRQEAIDAAQS
jgi:DNA-binding IclR family transcriptional regulator